jgi:hypothetical protein
MKQKKNSSSVVIACQFACIMSRLDELIFWLLNDVVSVRYTNAEERRMM